MAEVKDSIGELVGLNQVIYRDAFTDLKADIRYTYRLDGFEQDIILRDVPPAPDAYGLNPPPPGSKPSPSLSKHPIPLSPSTSFRPRKIPGNGGRWCCLTLPIKIWILAK